MVAHAALGQEIKLGAAEVTANNGRPVGDKKEVLEHFVNTHFIIIEAISYLEVYTC